MHICMFVCTHACMYVRTYVRMYACKYVYMCVCVYVCMHVCTYEHTCIHMFVCECMYACVCESKWEPDSRALCACVREQGRVVPRHTEALNKSLRALNKSLRASLHYILCMSIISYSETPIKSLRALLYCSWRFVFTWSLQFVQSETPVTQSLAVLKQTIALQFWIQERDRERERETERERENASVTQTCMPARNQHTSMRMCVRARVPVHQLLH